MQTIVKTGENMCQSLPVRVSEYRNNLYRKGRNSDTIILFNGRGGLKNGNVLPEDHNTLWCSYFQNVENREMPF